MKLKFSIIFLFIVYFLYLILNYEKEQKIDRYLSKQTELFSRMYNVTYNNFKQRAHIILDTIVNNDEIINIYKELKNSDDQTKDILREKLYKILKTKYEELQYTNLKQLHFHLLNNESFLRMHKPEKYGDDLTDIREDITFVNKEHKPVDGFAMGRVQSGMRFVYPLLDETNTPLGSVEVSFDISIFSSEFMEHFEVLCNFHLEANALKNKTWEESLKEYYISSPLDGYYLEKRNLEVLRKYQKQFGIVIQRANKTTLYKAMDHIKANKTVSIYDKKTKSVITFLPIVNNVTKEVVAFFTIRNFEDYIGSKTFNFYLIFVGSTIFLGVIFYLLYKDARGKEDLNKTLEQKVQQETEELTKANEKLKKSEILHKEQKNFLDTLIQTAPIPFFYKDKDGKYIDVNDMWCEFTGFRKDEILGKSVFDVAPKQIAHIYHQQDLKVFNLEENPQIYESQVVNKFNQKVYDVIFYKSAFFDNEGKVAGIIGSVVDITKIKKLQDETILKEKMIYEQSKLASMGEMIGNIAHQWRQPLSVITTAASAMSYENELGMLDDEKMEHYTHTINDNAQYLSKTIDDFRNYIQGKSVLKKFYLKENIDNFLKLAEPVVKSEHINIVLNIEDDIQIDGYPNELLQCMMNFFNNTKDAFIEKKIEQRYIFIDIERSSDKITINIKDNAGGIPTDVIGKIFEPYFTTKHQSVGTGLGLHMTYNLITTTMKGSIKVSNQTYTYDDIEYTGAEFKLTLPL